MTEATSICPPVSAKHAKYIKAHLKELREQCNGFNHCLNELYSQENTLLILQGKDIELTHICSLVQPNTKDEVKFSCSDDERSMIRQDLATHLNELLSDEDDNHVGDDHNHALILREKPASEGGQSRTRRDEAHAHNENKQPKAKLDKDDHHTQEWTHLRRCIGFEYPDETSVDAVCMLQNYNTTPHVCGKRAIHHAVESFFNKQLQHLQCTCDSLPSARSPLYLIIGGAVGGFVLVSLIILLLCLVVQQKKKNKRKKKRGDDKWQVSYAAGDAEDASAYSEISDVTLPLSKYRAEALKQKQREGSPGPSLPGRYIKVPPPGSTNNKDIAGSIEYLEPWDSPRFSLAEVDYDDSNQAEGDVDVHAVAADRGSYFIPLGTKPDTGEDCGYETLTKNKKTRTKDDHSHETSNENVPDYFVLEPTK